MTDDLKAFLDQLRQPRPAYTCARLGSGKLVRLSKDCGCITHEGPHFLYADRTARALNIAPFLERPDGITQLTFWGFAGEERSRLSNLGHALRINGIERLLTDDDAYTAQSAGEALAA